MNFQLTRCCRRPFLYLSTSLYSTAPKKETLPDLPYDYNALEPVISTEIMKLHHQKHHQAYVNNLNISLSKLHDSETSGDLLSQVELQNVIKFNAGGHLNHSIFWKNLTPVSLYEGPSGALNDAIIHDFGSLEALKSQLNSKTAAIQGSGWGWLAYDVELHKLITTTSQNQDPVSLQKPSLIPLLGIDVWEHAYYLQYKNARPDYLKEIWKIINWKDVSSRLQSALQKSSQK